MGPELWWDTMLSLDIGGRGLFLPQLGVPDFVDSLMEALPAERSEKGSGIGIR